LGVQRTAVIFLIGSLFTLGLQPHTVMPAILFLLIVPEQRLFWARVDRLLCHRGYRADSRNRAMDRST
jgi:hypothetical protein